MSCESLRRQIELYAEGELADAFERVRIQRHLENCPACKAHLNEYDSLTASILAHGVPPRSRASREHIVERVLRTGRLGADLPATKISLVYDLPEATELSTRKRPRSWTLILSAAAALLISLGAFFSLYRWSPRAGRDIAYRIAELNLRSTLASRDDEPAGKRRWILDDRGQGRPVDRRARAPSLRLYGLDLLEGSENEPPSSSTGYVVDAIANARGPLGRSVRFYLVPDSSSGDAAGAVEIDPCAWFETADVGSLQARALSRDARLFRVYAVPSPFALSGRNLTLPAEVEEEALPWERAGPARWITPVTFRN